MVRSSFCSISPCPTAASHTSLSNYLGQQHQIIPNRNRFKKGTEKKKKSLQSRGGPGAWPGARNVDKCNANAERTEGRKMAVTSRANAWLISLGDPNSRGGGGAEKNVHSQSRMQHKQKKKRWGWGGGAAYLLSSDRHDSEGAPVMQMESMQSAITDTGRQQPLLGLYSVFYCL